MAGRTIHPFLYKIADIMKDEFAKEAPKWEKADISTEELDTLRKECITPSVHDPHQLRLKMWNAMEKDDAYTIAISCPYGKLIAAFERFEQMDELPLELWGRIMRLFTDRKDNRDKPYRVYFMANSMLRKMSGEKGQAIGPGDINGGYTYPCDHDMIFIYRAEDATRVLIHELFHSSCTDKSSDVDILESETEAWAELFYCGFISAGSIHVLRDWVARQSNYMNLQNRAIVKQMGDIAMSERAFPWRYTLGKQIVWERWGIFVAEKLHPEIKVCLSLRLTLPPPITIKKREGVASTSVML